MSCHRFEGQVAVITASTAGIGYSIAERLGLEGAHVVISSRKQSSVTEALEKLQAAGVKSAVGLVCHVGDASQRQQLVNCAIRSFPGKSKVSVLVSNAAVNPARDGSLLSAPESAIDKIFDINLKSSLLLVRDFLPHLVRGKASVVLVSSVTAFQPAPPLALYAVSKTALLGLVKGLAVEMAPLGVRVNGLAPGLVPTNFARALVDGAAAQGDGRDGGGGGGGGGGGEASTLTREQVAKINPGNLLGRLGRVEDMAAAVAYLASDDASFVTGETLVVAGGVPSRL